MNKLVAASIAATFSLGALAQTATPATPATPAKPASPATATKPATPATAATPATPATPAMSASSAKDTKKAMAKKKKHSSKKKAASAPAPQPQRQRRLRLMNPVDAAALGPVLDALEVDSSGKAGVRREEEAMLARLDHRVHQVAGRFACAAIDEDDPLDLRRADPIHFRVVTEKNDVMALPRGAPSVAHD